MTTNKTDITIVKTFDAPVQAVWKYWSQPEYFKQWWGPADATCIACQMDFKVGGKYLNCLRVQGADGKPVEAWATGTYKVIDPLKKLVFTDSFADKDGNIVPSSYYGIAGMDRELEVSLTFEALGDKTRMTLQHTKLSQTTKEARDAMTASWHESFKKIRSVLS
jgi:uncharacterized protein YndB with AHSA1/START domain